MKVLVTGGAGFIGSHFARRCLRNGWSVAVLDLLTYAGRRSTLADLFQNENFSFDHGDIRNDAQVENALARFSPDVVAHFAAESHVDRSITGPADFIQTNIVGAYTLLNATLQYWRRSGHAQKNQFRFLHVSTDEVFGALGKDGVFSEATAYAPRSPYAASKAASDHLVSAWGHTYGLPVLVTNCTNNYGPFQQPEKLIPTMILNAIAGRELPIYGGGENVRDWIHVEDHVAALEAILMRGEPSTQYCIGSRTERSNLQIVTAICDALDRLRPTHHSYREQIRFVEDRPGHDFRYAVDPTRVMTTCGWAPKTDLHSGLEATIAWYLANEWWWRPIVEEGSGLTRLGLETATRSESAGPQE